jgi:hydrophobic/amphiphilic exporter-1 (mainly G- bacteria), HAE1 family
MFKLFIRRPILSAVISVIIVCLGGLALVSLPITQFPDIVPPSVTVTTRYTGASADVMAKTVATPLERAINGVPGMTYMTTVCTNDGMSLTTVYFKVGTDPDVAAVNVQNRVTTVLDELPEEVIRAGVVTEKEVNSMLMYLNVFSTDTTHTEKFVYNFADINVLRELKRIDGVGLVEIMGSRDYAMRVWLNPARMAAYNLVPQDVTDAIRRQNIEAAPGKTGISSDKLPQQLQYVLQYTGKFSTPEEYGEIVLKALPDGSLLRLRDVATIEFDSEDYNMVSMTDGRPSASIMIKQRPGSNAREVIENIKQRMEEIKESSFAPGMDYNIAYDVSRFLDASITSVLKTLLEAFLLVFVVVYLFLQDLRSTLIPAIAVPVSLIGTFFFMQMLGFSINMLTLFALVLAIGIVVDNAIVVVEAVHVKMHEEKLSPYKASVAAIKEIGGAIIAITLVMSAVFVPVGFMEGTVGIFYRQFSLTLAVAIVISGINALTLSPALCALLLRPAGHGRKKATWLRKFFVVFNRRYDRFERSYQLGLHKYLGRKSFTYATLVLFFLATYGINLVLPTGFIPNEDQGMIYVNVDAPPGATVERSEKVLNQIQAALLPFDEIESISTLAGYSLMTETEGASYGMGMINLKAWDERDKGVEELMQLYKERTSHIKDADIQFFLPPSVPGFGNASGFELRLQDKTAYRSLYCGLHNRKSALTILVGHLDNQNRILTQQTNQHDQSHLCINIVLKSGQLQEEIRTEDSRRQRKDDRERQQQTFVLCRQQQIHEQQTDSENQYGLSARILFLTGNTRPFHVVTTGKHFLADFFYGLYHLTRTDSSFSFTCNQSRSKHVVTGNLAGAEHTVHVFIRVWLINYLANILIY